MHIVKHFFPEIKNSNGFQTVSTLTAKKLIRMFLSLFVLFFYGCEYFKKEKPLIQPGTPVARVHDKYLYDSDMEGIFKASTKEDSTLLANKFIDNWIHQQLLLHQAESFLDYNKEELEKKVAEYRYSLLVYDYEEQFVKKHLDTSIHFDEVKAYYEKYKDNFILKYNIFQGRFIKLPQKSPKLEKVRKWIISDRTADIKELFSYCLQFSAFFSIDDSTWYHFKETTEGSPFSKSINPIGSLNQYKYAESEDSLFLYFLRIKDFKMVDEISPLPYVKDQIKSLLLHKRRNKLAKDLQEQIFQLAEKNKDFEVIGKRSVND